MDPSLSFERMVAIRRMALSVTRIVFDIGCIPVCLVLAIAYFMALLPKNRKSTQLGVLCSLAKDSISHRFGLHKALSFP